MGFGCSVCASSGSGASAIPAAAPATPIIALRVTVDRFVIVFSCRLKGRVAAGAPKGKRCLQTMP